MSTPQEKAFQLVPIGQVQVEDDRFLLLIDAPVRPALRQLDKFSHVLVLWWADQHDNEVSRSIMQTEPPYADGEITGVFACRSEYRPNPIAVTTSRILKVEEEAGVVQVAFIDAFDGSPLLDLKGYFPIADRVQQPEVPEWVADWPEWLPEGELESV